ncbi:MAG TPA: hypothetical protein VKX17_04910 [Planctomycetota bacterium]|nr:hypothetical protein [Planctomycetota bacterium]
MTSSQIESRCLEPIAKLLNKELCVPRIYFGLTWPPKYAGGQHVDVLAIDNGGLGDVHAVVLKQSAADALHEIPRLMEAESHFRWIAFLAKSLTPKIKSRIISRREFFPPSGSGCIGAIQIRENPDQLKNVPFGAGRVSAAERDLRRAGLNSPELLAEIVVYPERFHGLKYSQIEAYTKNLEPDIYVKI